jgi:4'-phosphopantetheinyl transferase
MHLWVCNIDNLNDELVLEVLRTYPSEIAGSINSYKKLEDRKSRLISRLLIQKYMLDRFNDWCWQQWNKNENQKPFIKNRPFFNIAHSGKIVIVGFNDYEEIGVDIEEMRNIDFKSLITFFHPKEKLFLEEKLFDRNHFYNIWTKKEALLKALGIGLLEGLNHLNVLEQPINNKWHLHEIEVDFSYKCAVCTTSKNNNIIVKKIDQNSLNEFIIEKILLKGA